MAVIPDIKQNLKILGLNKSEISVFLALLSKGIMSMTQLSKVTNIPRTTVYRICENLADKKFIEWIIDQRGYKAKAVRVEMLNFLIQDKKSELESIQKALKNLKFIVKFSPKNLPATQVRYYKGKSGMKQLIWNTLKAKKIIIGYSIYGRKEIVGSKFIKKYIWEFQKRKLRDKVLVNKKVVPRVLKALKTAHQQKYEDVRVIKKKNFYISGDTYIYNNIYAVNFWNKDEIVGVEIENPEIAKMQMSIFNILWKIAKQIR